MGGDFNQVVMKEKFLPYQPSKMLKELGFNEPCFGVYSTGRSVSANIINEDIQLQNFAPKGMFPYKNSAWNVPTAPLYQQACEWLWDRYQVAVTIIYNVDGVILNCKEKYHTFYHKDIGTFNSPIEAWREGIIKAIEYVYQSKIK